MSASLAFGSIPRLILRPIAGHTFLNGILNLLMIHFTATKRISASRIMITLIRIMAPMYSDEDITPPDFSQLM